MSEVATKKMGEVVVVQDPATLIDVISRAAADPATDVDKLERLMALYERIEARKAETAFNVAMAEAQKEMRPIAEDAKNDSTKSKYATYHALDKAIRPIYTAHGFVVSFDTGNGSAENHIRVLAYVAHKDGHARTYQVDMPADGKGAKGGDVMTKTHAAGSAMSYGQRYLFKLIFNLVVGKDDDGNQAGSGDKITPAQAAHLREQLEAAKADVPAFCAFMKVEAVPDIAAKDFTKALNAILVKKGRAK